MRTIGRFVLTLDEGYEQVDDNVVLIVVEESDRTDDAWLVCEGLMGQGGGPSCLGQSPDDLDVAAVGAVLVMTDPEDGDPDAGGLAHCLACLFSEATSVLAMTKRTL